MAPMRSAGRRYLADLDWVALLGVIAFYASWGFANLWQLGDAYWFQLRLYPFGLLLTIALFSWVMVFLVALMKRRPEAVSYRTIGLYVLLAFLETLEISVYYTCSLFRNPLLDDAGRQLHNTVDVWTFTFGGTTCSRLIDIPSDVLSWVGGFLILYLAVIEPLLRRVGWRPWS